MTGPEYVAAFEAMNGPFMPTAIQWITPSLGLFG